VRAILSQQPHQRVLEVEIVGRGREAERVDGQASGFERLVAHLQVASAMELGHSAEAAAEIEDEGVGIVFLKALD